MQILQQAAADYHGLILDIGATTGLPDAMLHLHAGMLILLATALVVRRGLDDILPLGIVIIAACGNEVLDRINLGNWNWPDTRMDLFNTIVWPLTTLLVARAVRGRPFSRRRQESPGRARHRAGRGQPRLHLKHGAPVQPWPANWRLQRGRAFASGPHRDLGLPGDGHEKGRPVDPALPPQL